MARHVPTHPARAARSVLWPLAGGVQGVECAGSRCPGLGCRDVLDPCLMKWWTPLRRAPPVAAVGPCASVPRAICAGDFYCLCVTSVHYPRDMPWERIYLVLSAVSRCGSFVIIMLHLLSEYSGVSKFSGTGDPVYWVTGSPPRYCMPFKEGSIYPNSMCIQQFIINLR